MPSHQALAFSGSGWPPHSLSCASAAPASISKRSVALAGATGSTFSETSQITPSMPIEPASSARDVVAGDVLHHLAAEAQHLGAAVEQRRAEHVVAHAADRGARRPGQAGGDHAADGAAGAPKRGGSNGRHWPRSASAASSSASGVPARTVTTSSLGS